MTVDTDGAVVDDDLDTINGGAVGDVLILRASHVSHAVHVKNGTGNIRCGANRVLASNLSTLTLLRIQNEGWVCLA